MSETPTNVQDETSMIPRKSGNVFLTLAIRRPHSEDKEVEEGEIKDRRCQHDPNQSSD